MTKEQFEEISNRKYAEDRIVYIVFKGDEKATALHIVYDDEWLLAHNNLKDIYETKEDAEWEHEFGNIMWTEKLELPTWEQIQPDTEDDSTTFIFNSRDGTEYVLTATDCGDDDFYDWAIEVYSTSGDFNRVFDFTYDGYLEACRFCKKLFLGEELWQKNG